MELTKEQLRKIYRVYLMIDKERVEETLLDDVYKLTPFYTDIANYVTKMRAIRRFVIMYNNLFTDDITTQGEYEYSKEELDNINKIFYALDLDEKEERLYKQLGFVKYVELFCDRFPEKCEEILSIKDEEDKPKRKYNKKNK